MLHSGTCTRGGGREELYPKLNPPPPYEESILVHTYACICRESINIIKNDIKISVCDPGYILYIVWSVEIYP